MPGCSTPAATSWPKCRWAADGGFRFFAAPGTWTVRVLAPGGVTVDQAVTADYGQVSAVEVSV